MTDVRTEGGRFQVGNPGGPGRPRRATERAYLVALTEAVSVEDWRAVVERALDQAKAGDRAARDWLSRYLLDGTDPQALLVRIEQLEDMLRQRVR